MLIYSHKMPRHLMMPTVRERGMAMGIYRKMSN